MNVAQHTNRGMMMKTTDMNKLLEAATGIPTLAQLVEMMSNGYVPTIYQNTRRRRQVTAILLAKGWNVFNGTQNVTPATVRHN